MISRRCMINPVLVAFVLTVSRIGAVESQSAIPDSEMRALALAVFRFEVANHVANQIGKLGADAEGDVGSEIENNAAKWHAGRMTGIRDDLTAVFGDKARVRLESFIAEYGQAEKDADADFLGAVAGALDLDPAPPDYAGLRKAVVSGLLKSDLLEGGRVLGAVQTWRDMKGQGKEVPTLAAWLAVGKPTAAKPEGKSSTRVVKKKSPANDLADAEAESPDIAADEEGDDSSPLDNFADLRKQKRDRAMEEAQAGMAMVATERKAAEEEYANKKAAEATAEAEAMKAQAEKLAAVEKDALEQRQNSWGNRLKNIFAATVGAATGAFTSGVGARAGEEAVNAVFGDDASTAE